MSSRALPGRARELDIAEFDTASVVHDPRTGTVHLLEPVVAVVLDACDGVTTLDELLAEMVEAGGVASEGARATVTAALDALLASGLVGGAASRPPCLGCSQPTARWPALRR